VGGTVTLNGCHHVGVSRADTRITCLAVGSDLKEDAMALITCPECARDISDRAVTCPACGNPMRPKTAQCTEVGPMVSRTVTIEATGKTYKALQFAGAAAIALAVASCAAAVPGSGSWSGFVFLIGIALYTCGRIGAWWKHG
jgi:hypothetical protein